MLESCRNSLDNAAPAASLQSTSPPYVEFPVLLLRHHRGNGLTIY
jgi:hypothetical protein